MRIAKPKPKTKTFRMKINILYMYDTYTVYIYYTINIVHIYYIIHKLFYTYTHSLTPWCRVRLEKLIDLQLVNKFPAFHGTRKFITALTSVRHLSLSWASPIQSTYPHSTS